MRSNSLSIGRMGALFLALLTLSPAAPGAPAGSGESESLYHLRFLRARLNGGADGSALFSTPETVVPLSARELWGHADQTEALRQALGVKQIESLPGVVVHDGVAAGGGPHRFRTALGEAPVEVSFQAQALDAGWSRVSLRAETARGVELLDAVLRMSSGGTVAVVVPLSVPAGDALIIGVTPLPRGSGPDLGKIPYAGWENVTSPQLVSKTDIPYPERAKQEHIEGKIVLQAVIRKDGVPDGIVVLRMPERGEWLAGSAVEAISNWRYQPATREGVPVDVRFTIVVDFEITKDR
ncbi:MAG TPA: energy transducer TonB [Candidatus Polarisedimenticolia bacterium]|jgi:TonB family protein|nr:energy transducer TonB [Candidatus Polarisedimenticolia bacterium]